jgi:hypothetical protein
LRHVRIFHTGTVLVADQGSQSPPDLTIRDVREVTTARAGGRPPSFLRAAAQYAAHVHCTPTTVICELQAIVAELAHPSAWDSFLPTLLATVLGALFAAGSAFILFRAEQKRRDRAELLQAVAVLVQGLGALGDALITHTDEAVDAAVPRLDVGVSRFELAIGEDDEIVLACVKREYLWWTKLPVDEMSNRSQLLRAELVAWAKGRLTTDHFRARFGAIGDSGNEHPETPDTVPARLRG